MIVVVVQRVVGRCGSMVVVIFLFSVVSSESRWFQRDMTDHHVRFFLVVSVYSMMLLLHREICTGGEKGLKTTLLTKEWSEAVKLYKEVATRLATRGDEVLLIRGPGGPSGPNIR